MKHSSLFFLVFITSVLISCSTNEPFIPPANFDASTYVNPEKHGGNLSFSINPTEPNSSNRSFTPVTIKGGFKNAIQTNSFRNGMANSTGGGATIQVYVDSSGSLTQIERIKSTNASIALELEELAKEVNFNPAILNGEPINSYRQMEVYMASSVRSVRRQL